jgi:hypothetical protein
MGSRFDRIESKGMIEVDIRDDRYRGRLAKIFEDRMVILRGVAEANDVAAHHIQLADSNKKLFGTLPIDWQRIIIHRLDENGFALPDRLISYVDKVNVIHRVFSLS